MSTETGQVQDAAAQPAHAPSSELQPGQVAPGDGGEATPAPEGDVAPEEEQRQEEERQQKNRQRFDRRFSELSRRAREAEIRAARVEGELEALRRMQQSEQPKQELVQERAPNPRDYAQGQHDPRYIADLAKHEVRQEFRRDQEAEAQRRAEAERAQAEERQVAEGRQRLEETLYEAETLAQEHDWAQNAPQVLELAYVPVSQGGLPRYAVDAITKSDNPVHVAEVLGRNPRSLDALRRADRDEAARMIGALDAQVAMTLKRQAAPATKPAPKSQATPAPIPTIPGAGAAPLSNPEKMSHEDYRRWRAAK